MDVDEYGEYTLTDNHFECFTAACKRWIYFFGFHDWDIDYLFNDSESAARAFTAIHCKSNRVASIVLSTKWDIEPTEFDITKYAFHEVVELLLADVHLLAMNRDYSEKDYERESHRIIRIFEYSIFLRMWKHEHDELDIQSDSKDWCSEGQEISEIHSDASLHYKWVQRAKSASVRWFNRLSPF